MKCEFVAFSDDTVRCTRCGLTVRTRSAPERTFAVCSTKPRNGSSNRPQSKPCSGCQKRKAAMNAVIPGLGDAVEKAIESTGIKTVVNSSPVRKEV